MDLMDVVTTYPNGTTIELGFDGHGNQVYRVCNASGSLCRYTEPWHCAQTYAETYEEYFKTVSNACMGD